MGRVKATITLDRAKVRTAMALAGGRSMSDVIDLALDRLILAEELRRDLAAYARRPPSPDEISLGAFPVRLDLDDEEFDYEALYGTST